VYVVRAFIKMREVLIAHKEIARKVDEHEHRLNDQDEVIISIVEEMRKQRTALPPAKLKRKIGFSKPE
jgi:protein tyrosine phosphatase